MAVCCHQLAVTSIGETYLELVADVDSKESLTGHNRSTTS